MEKGEAREQQGSSARSGAGRPGSAPASPYPLKLLEQIPCLLPTPAFPAVNPGVEPTRGRF